MIALRTLALSPLALILACGSTGDRRGGLPHAPDIAALLSADSDRFGDLLEASDELRLKIELAVVVEGPDGPTLVRDRFEHGPDYFYPASAVKTCAAIAAARELRRIGESVGEPFGLDTPLRYQPLFADDVVEDADPSHVRDGSITAGHDMRKVFLVSDNAAYNRLYELAGNEAVNRAMRDAGLSRTRILHRLSEFRSAEDQLRTPRVELLERPGGAVLAATPERTSAFAETNDDLSGIVLGDRHTRGGEVVDGPMSFVRKNYMPLVDLVDMNVMLLRPDVRVPGRAGTGFDLTPGDRAFIAEAMAQTPRESRDPVYDPVSYPDEYSKFLLPGLLRLREASELTVRDKVGRAYGFSVTNSQVIDERSGRTFFLAATIYTNPNGVVGDGVYDYERADRFFADLGEVIGRAVFE